MTAATPNGARCSACGYPLAGVAAPICPECGRRFDPDDPTTFDASCRAGRVRRWRGRLIALALIIAAIYALAPRGYVVAYITLTDAAAGINSEISHIRIVGPPWLRLAYPRWTVTTDSGTTPLAGAPDAGTTSLAFRLGAKKLMLRRFWLRSSGSMGASGSAPPGLLNVVNNMSITPTSAELVVRSAARDMASGGGYGISVNSRKAPQDDLQTSDLVPPP